MAESHTVNTGSKRARAGAALWMLCVQFFVAEQVARRGWTLPYSFRRNYISDLGATVCGTSVCSPWHAVMNGSFVLQGLLIAGGAMLVWPLFRGVGRVGLGFLVASGVGVLVVGFVPEDGNMQVHGAAAALHFLGGGVGMMLVGLGLRGAAGKLSLGAGLLVVAATVFVGQRESLLLLQPGTGLVERVAAYGIVLWMMAAGFYLRAAAPTTSRTSG